MNDAVTPPSSRIRNPSCALAALLRSELAGEGFAVAYVFAPISPAVFGVWTEPHPSFLALTWKGLPIVYDLGGSEASIAQGKWYQLLLKGEEILHLTSATRLS